MFKFSKVELSVILLAVILFIGSLWTILNQTFIKNQKNSSLKLGYIVDFSNEFQTKDKESFYWAEGKSLQNVHRGDSIYVNPGSKVKIKLITNDEIILNENTLITLDQTNDSLDISLKTGVINSPLLTASIKIDFCGKSQSIGLREASDLNLQKRTDCKYQISVKEGAVQVGQRKAPKKFEIESNYLFKNSSLKIKNEKDEIVSVKKLSETDFDANESTTPLANLDSFDSNLHSGGSSTLEKALSSLEKIVTETTNTITEKTEEVIDKLSESFPESSSQIKPVATDLAPPKIMEEVENTQKKKSVSKKSASPSKPPPPPEPPFVVLPLQSKKNFYTQTGKTSQFTLAWKSSRPLRNEEKYQIEISSLRSFESELIQYESKFNFLKINSTLTKNNYFWRVRLKSKDIYSDWSPTAQFSIK